MEKERDLKPENKGSRGKADQAAEREAREALKNPPKDKREVTIGPTTGAGPDITVG